MKKTIVIIFAVAILGSLGLYAKQQKTITAAPSAAPIAQTSPSSPQTGKSYKDGTYQGSTADTLYGTVQISVVVSGGKISDVQFLQMPHDEQRSIDITNTAKPLLKQNTLAAQSSKIDFVSGATSTTYGYQESLQAALDKAAGTAMVDIRA